jgi:alpha-L-fucosidase
MSSRTPAPARSSSRRAFLQTAALAGAATLAQKPLAAAPKKNAPAAARDPNRVPTPLPRVARFESLAYGLFLHWGLYSQLGRGEWVMFREEIPAARYAELAATFTAADFDAAAWARFAREAGMRYLTLTTRHHDGFSLYDTRGLSAFDALHTPAKRDLVAEFVAACRSEGLVPFFYHTTLDWTWDSARCTQARFEEYLDYLHRSVEILCRHYGEIGGFWFDGNWSRADADWKEDRLYALIRCHQPDAVIINNTGLNARGARGHPEIDSTTFEQGLPTMPDRRGWPKYIAGEMCQTMNSHWGVGADDFSYHSPAEVIEQLANCRRVGANYLLNIGPTAQGGLPAYETAALRRVGAWVNLYDAILRQARPVADVKCPGRDFLLRDGDKAYYFAFDLPITGNAHGALKPGILPQRAFQGLRSPVRSARWVDDGQKLTCLQDTTSGLTALHLEPYPYGKHLVVRIAELNLSA